MRITPLLALACLATLPAHAAPATHEIPMWMQGGHPTVAVQLGDRVEPLHFVIDSAAGATVMDQATARRLGLDDPDAAGVEVEGATDSSAVLRRTRSTRWQVGTLSFEAATMQTDLSRLGKDGRRIDGILGNDVTDRFDTTFDIAGQRVLLLGAGGAAAGALAPLIAQAPALLVVCNRTHAKAQDLVAQHADLVEGSATQLLALEAGALEGHFDVVINATASSLQGAAIPVAGHVLRPGALAYDMMYGPAAQPFLQWAAQHGAQGRDGLGMLVEQAAEAFALWRGVRPPSQPVLAQLRSELDAH